MFIVGKFPQKSSKRDKRESEEKAATAYDVKRARVIKGEEEEEIVR